MNKEWNIGDIVSILEYTDAAIYCNSKGDRHIEKINNQYIIVADSPYVPTIEDQIIELEQQITARNIRSAILGDQYAINKMTQIEAQIEELRKQLESQEAQ